MSKLDALINFTEQSCARKVCYNGSCDIALH